MKDYNQKPEIELAKEIESDLSELTTDSLDTILGLLTNNEDIQNIVPGLKRIVSLLKIRQKYCNYLSTRQKSYCPTEFEFFDSQV